MQAFFDPWPIGFPKGWKFAVYMVPALECYKMKPCWLNANGQRMTVKETAFKIENDDWLGMRHTIRSLVRQKINNKVIIIDDKGIIFDGNHRINALYLQKYTGKVLVVKKIK